ncbi:uncharacterized protein NESG_01819 [Nematocida ausubeli]|uniref:Uncharacterized protein n=1 Tax=Nematocida ausubeli (strain ATCC PRA-371 / ERTm2) TaxID=1913371 RepID=A0A086J115_NEMA1|nr:uncharacterized protein NESG_01819 [Nematocida ausubeli]KFG25833.1 hypothetical protein NESG_01819 [Nematocida ausubeli]
MARVQYSGQLLSMHLFNRLYALRRLFYYNPKYSKFKINYVVLYAFLQSTVLGCFIKFKFLKKHQKLELVNYLLPRIYLFLQTSTKWVLSISVAQILISHFHAKIVELPYYISIKVRLKI